MSNLPLYDSMDDVPEPQPRAGVRLTQVSLAPYADGRRVKLTLALTPFLEKPNVEVRVTNAAGQEVATLSLIETMETNFEFTLHLRGPEPHGAHTAHLDVYYLTSEDVLGPRQIVDTRTVPFEVVSPYA